MVIKQMAQHLKLDQIKNYDLNENNMHSFKESVIATHENLLVKFKTLQDAAKKLQTKAQEYDKVKDSLVQANLTAQLKLEEVEKECAIKRESFMQDIVAETTEMKSKTENELNSIIMKTHQECQEKLANADKIKNETIDAAEKQAKFLIDDADKKARDIINYSESIKNALDTQINQLKEFTKIADQLIQTQPIDLTPVKLTEENNK